MLTVRFPALAMPLLVGCLEVALERAPTAFEPIEQARLLASDGAAGDRFGGAVAGVGDLDGDGYADVGVGAAGRDDDGSDRGQVYLYLYLGSADGMSAASERKLEPSDASDDARFGCVLDGAADLDGDGYDDLLVGAKEDRDLGERTGSFYVFCGSAGGVDPSSELEIHAFDPAEDDHFGRPAIGAGDLDGDGYRDVAVGSKWDDDLGDGSGSVYLYLGSSTGPSAANERKLLPPVGTDGDAFGCALAALGDLEGDGHDDLAVGASYVDEVAEDAGQVFVFPGGPDGVVADVPQLLLATKLAAGDRFGALIANAGDVGGDGIPDLIIGAFGADDLGDQAGAAYLFHGCPDACEPDTTTDSDLPADSGLPGEEGCEGCSSGRCPPAWPLLLSGLVGVISRRRR